MRHNVRPNLMMSRNQSANIQGAPTQPPNQRTKSPPFVRVVLAYADDSALQTVLSIYHAVAKRLARHFEFRDSCWRFGSFSAPQQLVEAAQRAAVADIIFCCPSDQTQLPAAVQDWIGLWTAKRNAPDGALAALLPTPTLNPGGVSPVRTYLERIAQSSGLTFFWKEYIPQEHRTATSKVNELRHPYGEDLVVCHNGSKPEVRHWGINE